VREAILETCLRALVRGCRMAGLQACSLRSPGRHPGGVSSARGLCGGAPGCCGGAGSVVAGSLGAKRGDGVEGAGREASVRLTHAGPRASRCGSRPLRLLSRPSSFRQGSPFLPGDPCFASQRGFPWYSWLGAWKSWLIHDSTFTFTTYIYYP